MRKAIRNEKDETRPSMFTESTPYSLHGQVNCIKYEQLSSPDVNIALKGSKPSREVGKMLSP